MAFPAYGSAVPSLSPYQASFRGYRFGFGAPFELKKIDGADLPAIRSGDAGRPRDHGLFVGLDVMGGRELTLEGDLHTPPSTSVENLILNPSFEYGATGWAAESSGAVERTTEQAYSGTHCLRGERAGSTGNLILYKNANNPGTHWDGAVEPGETLVFSAYFRAKTTARSCSVRLEYFNAANERKHTEEGNVVTNGTSGWTRASVADIVPAEMAYVRVSCVIQECAAGESHYIDALMLTQGTPVLAYFDGDTPGYEWAAGAGESVSKTIAGGQTFQEAWEALAKATLPGGNTEEPLYLNLPGYGTLATLARVRKRHIPIDIQLALGNLASVTLLFASSDPRWYSTPTQQASVSAAGVTAGFGFPLTFNLSFGGGSSAGALDVANAGNIETRPILIVEGPCNTPSITNASISGAPTLTFNLVMAAGDKLVIDTDMHTATYYTSGTTVGFTRLSTLALGSAWWTLEPGTNLLQFSSRSGEGTLYCQWASARLL